jgi:anti-sigma factor ChrR (cupin superfamily)
VADPRILLSGLFGPNQDFSAYPWQPFRPGVEIARIYGEGSSGPAAALLRYAPGARVPSHDHGGYEHIVVLQGSQTDDRGTYGAGSCLIHAPGSSHAIVSDSGCVVLAIWNAPVVFR